MFVFIFWFSLSGKILQLMYIFELIEGKLEQKRGLQPDCVVGRPGVGGGGTVERSEAVRARSAR